MNKKTFSTTFFLLLFVSFAYSDEGHLESNRESKPLRPRLSEEEHTGVICQAQWRIHPYLLNHTMYQGLVIVKLNGESREAETLATKFALEECKKFMTATSGVNVFSHACEVRDRLVCTSDHHVANRDYYKRILEEFESGVLANKNRKLHNHIKQYTIRE